MQRLLAVLVFWISAFGLAQTKVGGVVVDELGDPVAFANVLFKNSTEGTISNEDGRFYLESQNRFDTLVVSFVGYASRELVLSSRATLNMEIVLVEGEQLDEVVVFMGKQSKKNNPAIDILRKIWAKKRSNGLRLYDQYRYDEYEKIEFDLNTIDSAWMQSKLFRGMEFVFDDLDTSRITGKTYWPVFINEKFTTV
ncbi:carboxypeptidase-like regulatory domain-containing protein [Robiginitalea sp.]|uniref:carboxypeptidase-like regulatory domain-containing protein n=1 Tax=Robiginitalea sp. TaxID=1902411 RepID=UPI003C739A95